SFIVTSSSNAYANYLVGSSFSFTTWRAIFQDVADPVLQTESYLFETDVRKFPGNINFNTTNTTPLLIAGVGRPFQVAGWAKQSIANGYSSKFAYLGQYFDKAFKADTNGYATTNQTGVLSEYGEFLPTEPGRVILTTKPDLDTGAQAQCGVYCIKLELDVNHDGVMDHSLNGPDNTSQSRPFVFWLNDDRDGIGEGEEKYSGDPDYLDGHIKSRRDLEDFARLWISGMPPLSHSVTAFAGCSVKLHWRDPFNAPSIKIYAAADTNGSIGYLTETNAANQQITGYYEYGFANLTHFYDALVEIAPDTDWFIPDDYFGDGGRTKFIFEGSGVGEGELVLTVSRQGQIVGETSVWIAIKPITELYEWAEAVDVATNKPPAGLQSRYLLRNRMPVNATEQKDVIVFVHGINNKLEEARRSAETTFKRLYWQGYRGRIAGFFWPQPLLPECAFTVPRGSPYNYDIGEFFAWKSAKAFKEYLEYLRTTSRLKDYSIHILGHSQGNIVVSEALRQGAPFDDFILSQAAAPAHCYSTNAPFLQRFLNKESEAGQQTPFTYQEGGYHGCFTNLTGRIISFYNTNDYALAKGFCTEFLETNWEANQENYKPEYYTYGGVIDSWGFNTNTRQSWYLQSTPLVTVSNFVTDLHIAKSFVARSRSRAVGAQDNMAGVIQASVNLNAPPFNFGRERTEHSAQFAYPIQGAGPYWQQVLSSFGISPF
ncbi:MAG: alpha/beta hydrolase, partial [Verrucomicrobia bacterium]|nr:alpha/beta hydrolase [Verrucomicrobiota bacterium]